MIDRVTKNWKTTAVGAVLFAAGIILVAMEKATLTEAGTFFGVAFMLFFSKDKMNG
jgi:dipeptide/tripeptide permease